ncbi:FAD-dependent oxidoreductase [Streptomyces chartreusis]|uniref:FAD-dependent oxidoreductase n=1 Tax=Streptomyces chartreusis TaxID=1969 RepID=UPI0036B4709D
MGTSQEVERYDVIVVGGGTAGVAAAVGAADSGARALLVERSSALGGAATLRNVLGYCGLYTCDGLPRKAVGGVADRALAHLAELGGVSRYGVVAGQWTVPLFDPEAVKRAMDDLVSQSGAEVVLGASVIGARCDTDQVKTVDYVDFGGRLHTAAAAAFVDASGDGTLSALAGAAVEEGAEGRTQTATMSIRFSGLSEEARPRLEMIRNAVRSAARNGTLPITSSSGFIGALPVSGDLIAYLADEDLDPLDARSYTEATRHARRQAWAYLEVLRKLPGCEGAYIVSTGPELGIRQSRHLVASEPLRDEQLADGMIGPAAVALGAWPSEYHPGSGNPAEWQLIGGSGAFGITIDNLRSFDTPNLFGAGRVVGGGRRVGASVRVLGTAFATGHAAGVAAALTADGSYDAERLRSALAEQGAVMAL